MIKLQKSPLRRKACSVLPPSALAFCLPLWGPPAGFPVCMCVTRCISKKKKKIKCTPSPSEQEKPLHPHSYFSFLATSLISVLFTWTDFANQSNLGEPAAGSVAVMRGACLHSFPVLLSVGICDRPSRHRVLFWAGRWLIRLGFISYSASDLKGGY